MKNVNLTDQEKTETKNTANTVASPPVEMNNTMPAPKIKHDWYQTETHVFVTVLIKNLKNEQVKVNFTDSTVSYYV